MEADPTVEQLENYLWKINWDLSEVNEELKELRAKKARVRKQIVAKRLEEPKS